MTTIVERLLKRLSGRFQFIVVERTGQEWHALNKSGICAENGKEVTHVVALRLRLDH